MADEVERDLGLSEELVPQVVGEGGRDSGEDAEKVGFEGTDGMFGDVVAVDIGGSRVGTWSPRFQWCGDGTPCWLRC